MPKPEPKSFEITEYSGEKLDTNTAYKVIRQIFFEHIGRDSAQNAVWMDMAGDKLKIHYHSYEMHLPSRLPRVADECAQVLDATVREVKDEFKKRTGTALKLKEDKSLANYTVEKVSLNERYYFKAWRFYEMSF